MLLATQTLSVQGMYMYSRVLDLSKYAKYKRNFKYFRLLLDGVTDVDIADKRGYSPLHMAARSGAEENVLILLDYGADPNKAGDHGVTPLHRAHTLEVFKTLIRHGADECLSCTLEKLEDGKPRTVTAFEMAVDLQPTAAKFCLDENISTNGKDLTSRELIIVIDLGVIINSGGTEESEMAIHQKFIRKNFTNLLEHPLSETFLVLKHQLLRGFAYWNLALFFLFVSSLTSVSVSSTNMWACCEVTYVGVTNELESNFANDTTLEQFCELLASENAVTSPDLNNIASSVTECLSHKPDCHPRLFWAIFSDAFPSLFWVLYITTWSLFGLICIREMCQAYSNWCRYVFDKENWLEILMLALTSGYLATLLSNPNVSAHLGALSLLIAWADFALLIGRFPNIGIYIYMSIHIMKKIVTILLSFTPVLLGFAFAFRILIPNSDSFDNIFISVLKVLVMMIGEFDFEDNFRSEKVGEIGGSNITTQLVFILFLFVVSIVISNLLIGLTVNETDIVFKSALGMRLERAFSQIVAVEDHLATSLSKTLYKAFKIIRPTVLKDYLDSLKENYQARNSYKIYLTPNYIKKGGYWWEKLDDIGLSIFRGINHPVYLHNENDDKISVRTRLNKLELPDSTVQRIFNIIRKREHNKQVPVELAPTKCSDVASNMNDKILNLEIQLKQMKEMQRKTEETLEVHVRLVQDNLENAKLMQKDREGKLENQINNIEGKVEVQIKKSQEKIEEKLARLESCITRALKLKDEEL